MNCTLLNRALLALVACAAAPGCETSDPCALRKAACLDVVMMGKREPVFYRNLTIKIVSNTTKAELARGQVPELRATAPAGVQGLETFQLPDSFNDLPDTPPAMVIEAILGDEAKIEKLKELRNTDPRAIQITIDGTEDNNGMTAPVRWDSAADEMAFSPDQWLMQRYYRVARNQYLNVYAVLAPAPPQTP